MDDEELRAQAYDAVAMDVGRMFARYWWQEARKLEYARLTPDERWALLLAALRRFGWPDERP